MAHELNRTKKFLRLRLSNRYNLKSANQKFNEISYGNRNRKKGVLLFLQTINRTKSDRESKYFKGEFNEKNIIFNRYSF